MIDLVYRPLFLEAGRISRAALLGLALDPRGTLSFHSPHEDPLESLIALVFWLRGSEPDIRFEAASGPIRLSAGGLRLECGLPGRAASPEAALGWEGQGSFESGGADFRFTMGDADRLFVRGPGPLAERMVFLPEGDGAYYARLEARQAPRGMEGGAVLPAELRERVRSIAAAEKREERA